MLIITWRHPAAGRFSERADIDAEAFHESALTFGLGVATTAESTLMRATCDPLDFATFYADIRASGIEHVVVSRGTGMRARRMCSGRD
jgi:hypothetical protein